MPKHAVDESNSDLNLGARSIDRAFSGHPSLHFYLDGLGANFSGVAPFIPHDEKKPYTTSVCGPWNGIWSDFVNDYHQGYSYIGSHLNPIRSDPLRSVARSNPQEPKEKKTVWRQ